MEAAWKTCHSIGANLPIINSAEENTFISDFLKRQDKAWIGLKRNASDSKFYWVDGTPIEGNYNSWGSGQPNNWNGKQNCAFIVLQSGHGVWNDKACAKSKAATLCQKAMQDS